MKTSKAKRGDRAAFLRAMATGAEFWYTAKHCPKTIRRRVVKARSSDLVLSSATGKSEPSYLEHPKADEVTQVCEGVFVVRAFDGTPMRYEFNAVPTFDTWAEYWASIPKTYDLSPLIDGRIGIALQFMRHTEHHAATLVQMRGAVRKLRAEGWRRGKILAFS